MNHTITIKSFSDLSVIDLYKIMALRQEVFIVEQDCPYLDADGIDPDCLHVMMLAEGLVIGYTRLVPPGISYQNYASIGRVVNAKSHRKHGLGKKLMSYSIKQCQKLYPGYKIKISAQVYLNRFYTDLGFKDVGESYLEDGIPHIAMILS